ncbi:FAD binding domain-containing protein [Actinoplanes sp. TRM 88003]|uniref:FAD binding domain-containing protein n=1 Tax=Paractinoplanes aksuensis TaxID=2939490 RepID=A0ABT1DSW8_9ACTN|nr:FAD binding domain-containing protein [Actinoplanes aksuensis]MCO8273931.1 FAD binding domain-containing protein [Actinoplanes aksuensis]
MLTEVHVPEDVPAAVGLIASGATILGGGTALMPALNDYGSPPTALVSLRRTGLAGITVAGSTVTLGATTTLAQIEHDARLALLNPVVRSIASVPVRTLATVGGNLFVRQPHGDLAVALVALDARATLAGHDEPAELPLRQPALVTAVTFERPEPGIFKYVKAARRRFNSASLVTVAATVVESGGIVTGARVALGGVGDHVLRAHAVEEALIGRPLNEATVHAAAQDGLTELSPADDAYASAWYRKRVFPVHLRRALLGC